MRNELPLELWSPNIVVGIVEATALAIRESVAPVVAGAVFILYFRDREEAVFNHRRVVEFYLKAPIVFRTAFGSDLDSAVLPTAAVERRGVGAFQHRDGLDVVRVDVPRIGLDGHTVHHIKRLVAPEQHRRAAEQLRRCTDGETRHPPVSELMGLGSRALIKSAAFHVLNGIAHPGFFFFDAECRDYYL